MRRLLDHSSMNTDLNDQQIAMVKNKLDMLQQLLEDCEWARKQYAAFSKGSEKELGLKHGRAAEIEHMRTRIVNLVYSCAPKLKESAQHTVKQLHTFEELVLLATCISVVPYEKGIYAALNMMQQPS